MASPRPRELHRLRDRLLDVYADADLVLDRGWLVAPWLPAPCRAPAADLLAALELARPELVAFQRALAPELARLDQAARQPLGRAA